METVSPKGDFKMIDQLYHFALFVGLMFGQAAALQAADPVESDYYQIDAIPMPDGVVVETSGIEMMPDGKLAVCGRRGTFTSCLIRLVLRAALSGLFTPRGYTSRSTLLSPMVGSIARNAAS